MVESIKEVAERLFGANASPVDLFPPREVSIEEMLRYRTESKEKLSKRKQSRGKESTGDTVNPCPKCAIINWDQFPDGRKYCLNCGAVVEIDGTVTGGAIKNDIKNKGEDTMVEGELKCEKCGKVQQISTTEKELMEFIKQSHQNCGGKISFSLKEESKDIESKPITGAQKQNIECEVVPEKGKRFEHPKREKFVCYRCDRGNCSRTYDDAIVCLLINIDMKLKKLLERQTQ